MSMFPREKNAMHKIIDEQEKKMKALVQRKAVKRRK